MLPLIVLPLKTFAKDFPNLLRFMALFPSLFMFNDMAFLSVCVVCAKDLKDVFEIEGEARTVEQVSQLSGHDCSIWTSPGPAGSKLHCGPLISSDLF